MAGGFLSLTAFQAEGCGDALTGDEHKVSVTGLAFCIIWHDTHAGNWLAAPDFPLCRGQNKTPRNTLFISDSTVSTGYSAPACGGKVVAPATKGGHTGMVREVYDSLFFSSDPSFPLEGKSREAGKGVRGRAPIGCSIAVLTASRQSPERRAIRYRIRVS